MFFQWLWQTTSSWLSSYFFLSQITLLASPALYTFNLRKNMSESGHKHTEIHQIVQTLVPSVCRNYSRLPTGQDLEVQGKLSLGTSLPLEETALTKLSQLLYLVRRQSIKSFPIFFQFWGNTKIYYVTQPVSIFM